MAYTKWEDLEAYRKNLWKNFRQINYMKNSLHVQSKTLLVKPLHKFSICVDIFSPWKILIGDWVPFGQDVFVVNLIFVVFFFAVVVVVVVFVDSTVVAIVVVVVVVVLTGSSQRADISLSIWQFDTFVIPNPNPLSFNKIWENSATKNIPRSCFKNKQNKNK